MKKLICKLIWALGYRNKKFSLKSPITLCQKYGKHWMSKLRIATLQMPWFALENNIKVTGIEFGKRGRIWARCIEMDNVWTNDDNKRQTTWFDTRLLKEA